MIFRTRILIACLVVALVPLTLFALGARRAVHERLTSQFRARIAASTAVIRQDLARQAATLDTRLHALATRIDEDPAVRAALLQGNRTALLDYAPAVMPVAGLDYLLLVDSAGALYSSGHFRSDYDRSITALPQLLAAGGPVLIAARRPAGKFLALARARPFQLGGRRFALVGGTEIDSAFARALARDADSTIAVRLAYPGGALASSDVAGDSGEGEEIVLPFVDDASGAAGTESARWTIAHSNTQLQRVLRGMDRWFIGAGIAAIMLAVLAAQMLARRVNQPLEELAQKATQINLERMDVSLRSERADEVGALAGVLDAMVRRLRASAQQLRSAERRATVGDLARQVNHDLRNGLLPIRNVIQHLGEVAEENPAEVGRVFAERQGTLQGGISYLENLATNYARLTPATQRQLCDVNAIVRNVFRDLPKNERTTVQLELSSDAPRVSGDPVALRRIIENLAVNAVESLHNGNGQVHVGTAVAQGSVVLTVADNGAGIAPADVDHIFDDFFTTKERGSGLGLSIVRRLVADLGGRISVQSERGRGTRFTIELPGA